MNIYRTTLVFGLLCCFSTMSVLAKEHTVKQKNKSFVSGENTIETFTVKLGDSISFENADPFFHNIFSLSDLKTFDLGSYKKGNSKNVVFDKVGMVEVECAIHPQMYLEVTVK